MIAEFGTVSSLPPVESDAQISQISINRIAAPALDRSIPAVKADAARGLFGGSCKAIIWAIIDSGIDASHPAFETSDGTSRVKAALDFTRVRDIVSSDTIKGERRKDLLNGIALDKSKAEDKLDQMVRNAKAGLATDWNLVEELITLKNGTQPQSFHGTHVAGIIGAKPKEEGHPGGMCHDINLYDFRVLGENLAETEFAVISAQTMLLTGDARGDKILEGLELVGLVDAGGTIHLDVLKVPHHGSDNNVETSFFKRVTADHYVLSGNGEHGNPERATLAMLLEARGNAEYTIHLTYPLDEIDRARKEDWEKEQTKERNRQKKNPGKKVRPDWSPAENGLIAFMEKNPEFAKKVTIVEADKPHLINLLEPVKI